MTSVRADVPRRCSEHMPRAPVQADGHHGLSSPRFTAEASTGHLVTRRPALGHPQGQPQYPKLLKVKLPSTRTEAHGRWAWGPAQWGLVPRPGAGSRQTGKIAAQGRNFLKREMWMGRVMRGSPRGVTVQTARLLGLPGRVPSPFSGVTVQTVQLPGLPGWIPSPLASL